MGQSEATSSETTVRVQDLGGIDETTVSLHPGVNVLAGRNATNRTSFLRAIMGALGSDSVSLKADADEGHVELDIDGETYTRRLVRRNGNVTSDGDPYLDDSTLADLFAFLLESNEARLAVSRGDDLRDLIMRPVDVEDIRAEIEAKESEKRRLKRRIDELASIEEELPSLEAEKRRLNEKVEEVEAELVEKREELEAADGTVESSREDKEALETKLQELQAVQSSIENARFRRETESESIDTLKSEREEIASDLEALPEAPTGELSETEAKLSRLRERRSTVDASTTQLQSIIQFNEEMLEGTNPEIAAALRGESGERDAEALTEQLLADEAVVCWTCGSEVDRSQIESTIDRLREVRRERIEERNELRAEIDQVKSEQQELERAQRERTQLERRLDRTETELDDRERRIEELNDELESLRERARELEDEVDDLETTAESEVLDRHKEVNQLEFDLDRLESERDNVEERIETIEAKLGTREDLQAERERVGEALVDLRTRIETIEERSVEAFNEHMDAVLEILGYENIDRIWIERTEREVREGRRKVNRSFFDLHIIRTADGTTYEDSIEHLSESERKVTGLVFALAGYLVHDVHETVPFMLLDSLEAIDSSRIATLVDYFSEYADRIVVALLPEDAAALDDQYHRITEI
ncbi:archaea-specific SMC-related protein [Haloferacaceae archaeon DSL9]